MGNSKKEVETLISSGKTELAFPIIEELLKNSALRNEYFIIKSEFEEIERELIANTISFADATQRKNRIKFSLLKLISNTEENKILFKPKEDDRKKLKREIIYAIIIVAAGLIFAAYYLFNYFNTPDELDNNDQVTFIIDNELDSIYDDYKHVYLHGVERMRFDVIEKSKGVVIKLQLFKDEDLEIHGKIYKHIGLLVSKKIICLLNSNSSDVIKYSAEAIEEADRSNQLINQISDIKDIEYKRELISWVSEKNHETRIAINKLIVQGVNYKAGGMVSKEDINDSFLKLSGSNQLLNQGYKIYPIIKYLEEKKLITLK